MANAADCNDLYFFGEGQVQNNPRHVSIMGYEGDRPVFIQFMTVPNHTSTQTRVSRDQREVAIFDWTAGTHLGLLTVGQRQLHMGQLVRSRATNARRFLSPVDGLPFEWRRTQSQEYELYSPGDRRIATYSRMSLQTKWGVCHGLFRYTFKNQDALLLEALLALSLNRWIDLNGSM
ncbi:hypothetical protein K439DRAFT_385027 [Ramaria rubella]|nr:hypothetical protein K439DRAFT_385027 [Ramaria rubella]